MFGDAKAYEERAGKSGNVVAYGPFLQALHGALAQLHAHAYAMPLPTHHAAPAGLVATSAAASRPLSAGAAAETARAQSPAAAQPARVTAPATADAVTSSPPPLRMAPPEALPVKTWPRAYPAGCLAMADREPYPYFQQQEHRPHNRRECDTFNKFHFGRLAATREGAVTPKVGEEPLTVYEAEYARQVDRNRSPSPAPRQVRLRASSRGWAHVHALIFCDDEITTTAVLSFGIRYTSPHHDRSRGVNTNAVLSDAAFACRRRLSRTRKPTLTAALTFGVLARRRYRIRLSTQQRNTQRRRRTCSRSRRLTERRQCLEWPGAHRWPQMLSFRIPKPGSLAFQRSSRHRRGGAELQGSRRPARRNMCRTEQAGPTPRCCLANRTPSMKQRIRHITIATLATQRVRSQVRSLLRSTAALTRAVRISHWTCSSTVSVRHSILEQHTNRDV